MTVSVELRRSDLYKGDGSVTEFSFPFKIFTADQITVYRAVSEAVDEVVQPEEYSVELNADQETTAGGKVIFTTAPAKGVALRIISNVDYLQETEIRNQAAFYPKTLNDVHDKLTMLCQQLLEQVERCVIVPVTSTTTREELLQQLMEVAATANEYVKRAEEIYQQVVETQGEVEEAKNAADASASDAASSALSAQQNAEKIAADKATAEELLKRTTELADTAKERLDDAIDASETAVEAKETAVSAANSAGFSCRYYVGCTANNTYPLAVLSPSINAKVGDHVINGIGELFEVIAVSETAFSVGDLLTSIKGEKGDKGDSLKIADTFETVGELEATYPNGIEGGVLVGGDIFYWSPTAREWVSQGKIQGPAGEPGKDGVSANEILMNPDPVGYFNEIYGMTNAVADELVVNVSGTSPALVSQFEEGLKG